MPTYHSASGSVAEDLFIELFSETFGAEKAGYLYSQYHFYDIYQNSRYADFVLENGAHRVAIEIDDETSHNKSLVASNKFYDDLLKQNSMVHLGWDVYRWAVRQMQIQPEKNCSLEHLPAEEEIMLLHERVFCSDMLTARHLRSMQKFQDQNKTEVFISHSSVDLAFSRAIATDLMDAGFSVFLDDWSINIGERIFEKISTGLCESKALIMIISKDYLKSVCCTDEWGAFYGKALHDKSCVIYPIIIDDSAPPALISQIKYLRFNGDEYASALSTLLRSLRKQFSK